MAGKSPSGDRKRATEIPSEFPRKNITTEKDKNEILQKEEKGISSRIHICYWRSQIF